MNGPEDEHIEPETNEFLGDTQVDDYNDDAVAAVAVDEDVRAYRNHSSSSTISAASSPNTFPYDEDDRPQTPLPPLSSPSQLSSPAYSIGLSPLRRELSRTTLRDEASHTEDSSPDTAARLALARRLRHLAKKLTEETDFDDWSVARQVESLERAMDKGPGVHKGWLTSPRKQGDDSQPVDGTGQLTSPSASKQFVPHQLGPPLMQKSGQERKEDEPEDLPAPPKRGMTAKQAQKIIAETTKLNDELTKVMDNLRARQEESEHIQALLINRAERAAQRIIFLQSRISYLEEELQENDDELQHLRISLKAVEVQLPPNPDTDLLRCIAIFKDDYRALKEKRASLRGSPGGGGGGGAGALEAGTGTGTWSSPTPVRR